MRWEERLLRAVVPWRWATEQEVALVQGVLAATDDARAEVLVRQFAGSPVRRRRTRTALRVGVLSTTADLTPDVDVDRTSAWVPATTTAGLPLRVRLTVLSGGFLSPLEVEASDRLPRTFELDIEEFRAAAAGALDLGGPAELPGLRTWVRRWLGRLLRSCPVSAAPGGVAARAVLERAGTPPADLVALVEHADGLRVGARRILRVADIRVVELGGVTYWVIDEDAHAYAAMHGNTGRVHSIDKPGGPPDDSGVTLQEWFRAGCTDD